MHSKAISISLDNPVSAAIVSPFAALNQWARPKCSFGSLWRSASLASTRLAICGSGPLLGVIK